MALIELKELCMSYEGTRVINDLSLKIESGDYLCIVGENGSGKTTLLRGILGLKKIDKGEIVFGDDFKINEIGYLPQQNEMQKDFPASVREVVRSGRINRKKWNPFYTAEDKKMADEAMEKLEISPLSKKCFHELSGGQQQKVLLARAICASSKLIVLDEPASSLDASASVEMYDVIDRLNRDGMTVIMISHDIKRISKSAAHILHIGENKSLFYGCAGDYVTFAKKNGIWESDI